MKAGRIQTPVLQDVCIFCATRLQLSKQSIRVVPQRRFFRHGGTSKRPPEAVAAAVRHEEVSPEVVPQGRQNLPDGTDHPKAHQQWDRPLWQGTPRFTAPNPPKEEEARHPYFESAARTNKLDRFIGAVKEDVPERKQLWKCECGFHNRRQRDVVCRNCEAPPPKVEPPSDEANVTKRWRHLKRNGMLGQTVPKEEILGKETSALPLGGKEGHVHSVLSRQERAKPQEPTVMGKEQAGSSQPAVGKELEAARQKRLDQSKNTRFVGLESRFKKPILNFEEIPPKPKERGPPKPHRDEAPRPLTRKHPVVNESPALSTDQSGDNQSAARDPLIVHTSSEIRPQERSNERDRIVQEVSERRKWSAPAVTPVPEQPCAPSQSLPSQPASAEEPNQNQKRHQRGAKNDSANTQSQRSSVQNDREPSFRTFKTADPTRQHVPQSSQEEKKADESVWAAASSLSQSKEGKDEEPWKKTTTNLSPRRKSKGDNGYRSYGNTHVAGSDNKSNNWEHRSAQYKPTLEPWKASEWPTAQVEPGPRVNDNKTSPKQAGTVNWKAWSLGPAKKAPQNGLNRDTQQLSRLERASASLPRSETQYVSMEEMQQPGFNLVPQETPAEEDRPSEHRANTSRMSRRLRELDGQNQKAGSSNQIGKRPAPPRFDQRRESRGEVMKTRKHLEKEDRRLDDEHRDDRREARKKQRKKQQMTGPPTPIYLPEFISVANLAGALRINMEEFTRKMEDLGFEETNTSHVLDAETAGLIAAEFNYEPVVDQEEDQDLMPRPPPENKSILPQRPPVVTIMGHVDHGKTTLLDWLRKSSVAATEFGGITQHIGAFSVPMPSGRLITFLDTPGHAAFLDMRQRGANVTDIVILVVAANDSVKPQTIEAIKHAQAAKVPMIVAVNKIDKDEANVEKVKQDLARYGVEIEDYGGDTQVVPVSGKTGQGMETLEESAVALADILDMRAETDGQAEGWVLEATTRKAGRIATVLVRRGTLYPGDIVVAGTTWARVRTLRNEAGVEVKSAGPGTPVEVDGWKDQPAAGDEVLQAEDEQHARSVMEIRLEALNRAKLAADINAVNEARRLEQERREVAENGTDDPPNGSADTGPTQDSTKDTTPGFRAVPLLIKADVSGSVEAVLTSILSLGNNHVRASILRSGVGPVSESDVAHAASAEGHIVTFNLSIDSHIRRAAEASGVRLLEQNIIYRLTDLVKGLLEEYLEPERTRRVLGEAELAQVFEINVKGRTTVPVAGCRVRNGTVERNKRVIVRREGEVVFDGALSSLKNRKQDATEMRKGTECGMGFEGWTDFKVGDQIQSYEEKVEKRTL